jgi:HEAT repeat protein
MKKNSVLTLFFYILFSLFVLSVVHAQSDQVDRLIQNLDSNYRDLRMSSVWTLGKVNDVRALEALISALKHKDLGVRIAAAEALSDKKDPKAIAPLINGLKENEEAIREAFVKSLQEITRKDFGQDHDKWEQWWNKNKKTFLKKD